MTPPESAPSIAVQGQATGSLAGLLAEGRALEPAEALTLVADVAAWIEAHGPVRRLTPESIVVDSGGRWSVNPAPARTTRTREEDYLAPEAQAVGAPSPRQQVYALSAVLFRALTGEDPFDHQRVAGRPFWTVRAPRPQVTARRPELPAELDAVVARGMATRPADRFPTPRHLVAAARDALAGVVPAASWRPHVADAPEPRLRWAGSAEAAPSPAERKTWGVGAPDRRRAVRSAVAAVAVAVLAGTAAAVLALSGQDGGTAAEPAVADLRTQDVSLSRLAGWAPAAVPAGLEPLGLRDPVAIRDRRSGATLVAGRTRPPAGRLVDPDFSDALARGLVGSALVQVRAGEALAFRDLRLKGDDGRLGAYLLPTTTGAFAIACVRSVEWGARAACDQALARLELRGLDARPVRPPAAYRTLVRRSLARINGARERAVATSASLRATARAYAAAEVSLGEAALERPAAAINEALVGALAAGADALRDMARAQDAGDQVAYMLARRRLRAAERDVQRGEDRLAGIGVRP